jgi:hypothetical protein
LLRLPSHPLRSRSGAAKIVALQIAAVESVELEIVAKTIALRVNGRVSNGV